MFICFCKNTRHHVHFRHSLTDSCQTVYCRILGTYNCECRDKRHPHFSRITKKISTIKQVWCSGIFQFRPGCIVMETKNHHRLHQTDQGKSDHHSKRDISSGIFHILRYRYYIFRSDKQPECHCYGGHNTFKIRSHTVRLMHHFPSTKSQHTDHSKDQHGTDQKKCYQILDLGKHIHTVQVGYHNHYCHNEGVHQAWNRQMNGR